MPKAVRFDEYGGVDVLEVREGTPARARLRSEVLVQVKATGINPGEAMIRVGLLHDMVELEAALAPGEGSDLAGVVGQTGPGDRVPGKRRGDRLHRQPGEPRRVRRRRGRRNWPPMARPAVGGGRGAVRGRCYRVRGRAAVEAGRGGDNGGGVGCGRRCRLYRGSAGPAGGCHRDPGTGRGRRSPTATGSPGHGVIPVSYGDGVGRSYSRQAGAAASRRFIDTVGRRLRPSSRVELGVARGPDRHHRRLRGGRASTGSRPTATPPAPAPAIARRRWPS